MSSASAPTAEDLAAASLVKAIDGPRLSIPVALVRGLGGDLGAAAFLAQAAFLTALVIENSPDKEGWFDLLQEGEPVFRRADGSERFDLFGFLGSWEAALGLGVESQLAIRRRLRGLGLLEESRRDIPARLHYRVRLGAYLKFLGGAGEGQIREKPATRFGKNLNLVAGKKEIKTQVFRVSIPESLPKSKQEKRERTRAHEADQPQGTARRPGGGGKPERTGAGIWHTPGNSRDEAALARIGGFPDEAVAAAIAEVLAAEPTAWAGRVLSRLLKTKAGGGGRPERVPVPPPPELTPDEQAAAAAARAAASEKLSKLQKKW